MAVGKLRVEKQMPATDWAFVIGETGVIALAARRFRAGLFGKSREDVLQRAYRRQAKVINRRHIERYTNANERDRLLGEVKELALCLSTLSPTRK
jgi:hypothetical protein